MLKWIRSLLVSILVIYIGLVAILYFQQRNFIYFPDARAPDPASVGAQDSAQVITVKTTDGLNLRGWYFAPHDPEKHVILFFHGNGGHIGYRAFKTGALLDAGYGVLLAEYRGYGGNSGKPTEAGLYQDADAYYDWLVSDARIPAQKIIFYGESLGSGVASYAASKHQHAGLILETPFTSLPETAKRVYFFVPFLNVLMHDHYPSVNRVSNINTPKLFLVAGKDEVIGAKGGLKLYEAANEPKTLKTYPNAYHNTVYNGTSAANDVLTFLSGITSKTDN